MRKIKHLSVLLALVLIFNAIAPMLPSAFVSNVNASSTPPTFISQVEPLILDDFNSSAQFGGVANDGAYWGKNDLGGDYWGDGAQTCNDEFATLNGTTWWDLTLGEGEPAIDLRNYAYLVYEIKGSVGSAITVNLWNQAGTKEIPVPVTSEWNTVRIPLNSFDGLDESKVIKMKHNILQGSIIDIDEIRFEAAVTEVSPLIFDNYDSDAQYVKTPDGKAGTNDLGGGYWGDGVQTCNAGILTMEGTNWWDMTFRADETPVDLRNYTYLVYKIKGSSESAMTVNLWNQFQTVSVPVEFTEEWQTVKIPLSSFTGLDKEKVIKMKHSITGASVIEIDEISFEAEVPTVVDDFDSVAQFEAKKNDLGGDYYYDGVTTSVYNNSYVSIKDTWWMSVGLNGPRDIRNYTHIVFDIKGADTTETLKVSFENTDWGTISSTQNVAVTTNWETVQIPLIEFTGLDMTKALSIKLEGLSGTIDIDQICFKALKTYAYKPIEETEIPEEPGEIEEEEAPANDATKTIIDDFNNISKFTGATHKNDLGGRYWGDGVWTCDKTKATLTAVTWLDLVLFADESGMDFSEYSSLTFVIKGSEGSTMNVQLKDIFNNTNTAPINIPIAETWETVQIPIADFTGDVDITGINKILFNGFNGVIDIDEIRLDKVVTPGEEPEEPITFNWTQHALKYAAAPIDNPLKGFMPFTPHGDDNLDNFNLLPHSMEWCYFPLKDFMTGYDTFDFTKLETTLNAIASRGHQAAFRVYLDYPNVETGIPQFLLDDGLVTYSYTDFGNGTNATSLCPDYNDPKLVTALRNFIAALGDRYDGDPRIGFVTTGLIGFWGEWHTYPYNGSDRPQNWMPSNANINIFLKSFDNSFNKTEIVTRYPMAGSAAMDMGYHDDSFAYSTLPVDMGGQSWHFYPALVNAGVTSKWETNPVGGELRPEIQRSIWESDPPGTGVAQKITGAEDYNACVDLTHASWLINHAVFKNPLTGDAAIRVQEGSRRLGYEYYVSNSYFDNIEKSKPLELGIEIENRGVAPFYYDWEVQLGVMKNGELVNTYPTDWKISDFLPEETKKFIYSNNNHGLVSGNYTLVMKVINPLSKVEIAQDNAKKFMFANEEQANNGWLTLGEISITEKIIDNDDDNHIPSSPTQSTELDLTKGAIKLKPVVENGKAVAAIDSKSLNKLFENAEADSKGNKKTQIDIQAIDNARKYAIQIPADEVASSVTNKVIEIKSPVGIISIPSNMFDKQTVKDAKVIEIALGLSDVSKLGKEIKNKVGSKPVIDISVTIDGRAIEWINYNASVEVSIDFKPTAEELKNPEHLVVWYINGEGKVEAVPSGRYDAVNGKVTFATTHFSQFAVAYVKKTFYDIDKSSVKTMIEVLASKGIIEGISTEEYSPKTSISRGEFIKYLVNDLNLSTEFSENFSDVNKTDPYYEAIGIAKKLGIASGYNNRFNPLTPITRQDMMVLVAKALKYSMKVGQDADLSSLDRFSDKNLISPYAVESAAILSAEGIILGDGVNINPKGLFSREEAAIVLYKVYYK